MKKLHSSTDKSVSDIHKKKPPKEGEDPYPWLDKDDKLRFMSDKQILDTFIDLKDTNLSNSEKKEILAALYA